MFFFLIQRLLNNVLSYGVTKALKITVVFIIFSFTADNSKLLHILVFFLWSRISPEVLTLHVGFTRVPHVM